MAQDSKHFFKFDIDELKEGKYYNWSKAELLLYITLKAHSDYQTHVCFPGYRTIQKLTGLSFGQIRIAIQKLVDRKIIECDSGAGRNTSNWYYMIEDYPNNS